MSTHPSIIRYVFRLKEESIAYEIDTAFTLYDETFAPNEAYPNWTRLDNNQCACCPLKTEDHTYCPAAIRMHEVLERFKGRRSIEEIELRIESERRNYEVTCDLQSGLNSMLGLQMATSGCPVVGQLRSMATFHVPFSSFAETLYRAVSGYLTKQYFIHKEGREADWDLKGLQQFYIELEGLNGDFSKRIKAIDQKDAISNAIVMFFASSVVVAALIEDELKDYKDYFTGQTVISPDS